jgi:hypothetical protein
VLRDRPRRPSILRVGVQTAVVAVVAIVALPLVGGLTGLLGNPFRSERTERIGPTLLTQLADLDELHAASAELQVVVEVEDDTRYLPDIVSGRQTTYLAAGSVDAVVDLGDAVVKETPDGLVVTLPAPTLAEPVLDEERSEVLDRDRGAFDRIGDAIGEPGDDGELRALAIDELAASAADTELLEQARASAEATIGSLLEGTGAGSVEVRFLDPAPAP